MMYARKTASERLSRFCFRAFVSPEKRQVSCFPKSEL